MKKRVEKYIPFALEAVTEKIAKNGKVSSEFNGYISSFGASVISSGLLPAIAFYSNENASTAEDRTKLMDAILFVLKKERSDIKSAKLIHYPVSYPDHDCKNRVLDAAVALKLAIRTFELVKRSS